MSSDEFDSNYTTHFPSFVAEALTNKYKSSKRKRSNYKCGRCGKLKKGHICDEYQFVESPQYQTKQNFENSMYLTRRIHELEQLIVNLENENKWLRSEIIKLTKQYCIYPENIDSNTDYFLNYRDVRY